MKKKIYLEGPIAHAKEEDLEWRDYLEKYLSEYYELINPIKSVGDYREILNKYREKYNDKSIQSKFKNLMRNIVKEDLKDIERADIEVAYIPKIPRSFGTICGLFYFKEVLRKSPSILITDRTFEELNNWELYLADCVCFSFNEAIKILKEML